jgi:hypothetical protein
VGNTVDTILETRQAHERIAPGSGIRSDLWSGSDCDLDPVAPPWRPKYLKELKSKAAADQLDEEKGALWKPIDSKVNTWKPRLNELQIIAKNKSENESTMISSTKNIE